MEQSGTELRQYLSILWHWLWLICLSTVIAGATAFVVSRSMAPIYRASSTLLISQARTPGALDYQDILTSERVARTYAELLTRRPVLESVAARLGLLMKDGKLGDVVIQVQPVRDTQLIGLSVESPDPGLAASIANMLPQIFIEQNEAIQSARFASSKANLTRELDILRRDIENVQAAIGALGRAETAGEQAEMARLQGMLTQYQNTYAGLLQSYENLRLAEAQSLDTVTVVEPADVPQRPIRPRVRLNALLAAIVGAMLAMGVAFLIEYLDDTVKSPEDVERLLGLSTLGVIARLQMENEGESGLILKDGASSPVAEAFRALRTNILFSSVDRPVRCLLVTSAGPGDGKTTVAANLAVAMAQMGQRVILVDADLRRPRVHRLFRTPNTTGITGALLDGASPEPTLHLQPTEVPNLSVLPSGQLPPNPSELLGSQRMHDLVERLKEYADVVIFDSPPVLAVTDAVVLSRQADGVLLVLEAGRTRIGAVQRVREDLGKVGASLLGAVLNKTPGGRSGYYYYYYYYYSDGTGRRRRRFGGKSRENPPQRDQSLAEAP